MRPTQGELPGSFPFGSRAPPPTVAVSTDGSGCLHYFLVTRFTSFPVKPFSKLLSFVLFRGTVDDYLYPNDKVIAGSHLQEVVLNLKGLKQNALHEKQEVVP